MLQPLVDDKIRSVCDVHRIVAGRAVYVDSGQSHVFVVTLNIAVKAAHADLHSLNSVKQSYCLTAWSELPFSVRST